jgi:very-short-patch-repair endonuclease
MNDFEMEVYDALTAKGMNLVPQLGCSKFRIDLAACHPTAPGKYVLAIECDGATYHSSYTARDRDRLRQQQLEKLGWTFHRIWSTDWFLRRDEEIDRALRAFSASVEKSNRGDNNTVQKLPAVDAAPPPVPATPVGKRSSPVPPIPVRESIASIQRRNFRICCAGSNPTASCAPTTSSPTKCSKPFVTDVRASLFSCQTASSSLPATTNSFRI